MERTYKNVNREKKEDKTISLPVSDYVEVVEGTLLHARGFTKRGKVKGISLTVEQQSGLVRIKYTLEKVRNNQEVVKFIHSKAGANNMGDLEVDAGDRLKIEMEPIEEGSIEKIWLSYTLEQ